MTTPRHRESTEGESAVRGVLDHRLASGNYLGDPIIGDPSYLYMSRVPWTSTMSMDDFVTPNFKERQSRGEIINNPMYSIRTFESRDPCIYDRGRIYRPNGTNYWTGYKTVGTDWYLTYLDTHLPDQLSLSSQGMLEEMAVTEAHARIELSQAMMLASLGEGRETVSSMCSIIGRAIKIARNVKRLRVKELAQELSPKELADRYMELRYALRPLVYDAKQIVDAYKGDKLPKLGRQTWRGYKEGFDSVVDTVTYTDAGTIFTCERESAVTLQVRAGVLTCIEAISKWNVWGFDSIAETAWELMPWSFVLDWFFNIGETLASWTPEMGVKRLASWVVSEVSTTQSIRVTGAQNVFPSGATVHTNYFSLSGRHVRTTAVKTRTIDPPLAVLPKFRLKLDVLKLVDLCIMGRKAAHL